MSGPNAINNVPQPLFNHTSIACDGETAALTEMLKSANQRRADARARERGARQDRIHKMEAAVAELRAAANWTLAGAIVNGAAGIGSAALSFHNAANQGEVAQATAKAEKAQGALSNANASCSKATARLGEAQEALAAAKQVPTTPGEAASKLEGCDMAAVRKAQQQVETAKTDQATARATARTAKSKLRPLAAEARKVRARVALQSANVAAASQSLGVLERFQIGQVASSRIEVERRQLELAAEHDGKRADDARQQASEASQTISATLGQIEKLNQARERAMAQAVRV